MNKNTNYCLIVPDSRRLATEAENVFDLVWRVDFTAPGFCVLDAGPVVDSHTLRSWMVELKGRLSDIGIQRGIGLFVYRSLARFDQQETTKFHLDGAPEQSMLMLGYEPSKVRSRLFLADYTRAAFDLGIGPQQFLQDYNPMVQRNEELLDPYVTELPRPDEGHSWILIVNNSSLPFTADRANPLGVMHKAVIVDPDKTQCRIVNSTMIALGETDEIGPDEQQESIATEKISQKAY